MVNMAIKNMVTAIDFGSSRITVLAGIKEVNKSFRLLASADSEYDGFANGQFIEPNALQDALKKAIDEVEGQLHCKLENVYVGVPAEFCFVYDTMLTKTFAKKTKITAKMIDSLFMEDVEENPYSTHSIVNKAPLFYIINDDNRTNDPIGMLATKIQAKTSYILVENKFKILINGILENLGIRDFDYLSNTLAESIYLIDEHKRNEGAILVDCGHITTSVAQIMGDGLQELKSFSLGGGFITADMCKALDVPFEDAEALKYQAIVTLSGTDDNYEVNGKKYSIGVVNEIILSRVDKIVEMIKKCMASFKVQLPDYIPIYLTGGGLNYIEGINDYFRRVFDREVIFVAPRALIYRKPDLSSSISLLNMAINLYK